MEVLLIVSHLVLLHSKVYETHDFQLSNQKSGGKQSTVHFFQVMKQKYKARQIWILGNQYIIQTKHEQFFLLC